METELRELCDKYGLTCISLLVYQDRVNVFPHWDDADGHDQCVSAHADTFDDAFADALRKMAALRNIAPNDGIHALHMSEFPA